MARIVPNYSAFRKRNRFGNVTSALPLFEIALVLVRLDHVAGPGKLLAARGAGASCGGFGFARNTATTFHVLCRLQVTNFSLLKSAPDGVNYIDIRRLFLHGRCRS